MAEPNAPDQSPIAEISHGPSAFEEFMDRNQKKLIALGIVIALGLAAWVVKDGIQEGAYLSAGNALVAAEEPTELEEVVKNHAGTPSAPSAAVLLSDSQWENGQQDAAITTLKSEIEANPDHPATSAAYARLAARLASQGKTDEAKAAYQELLDRPQAKFFAPYALVSLGQIAKTEGDLERAKDYFTQAIEGYPGNPLSDAATKAMQFADFEMPEEVDPPAPAAEEAAVPPADFNPAALSGATGQTNPLIQSIDATPAPAEPQGAPATETPAEEKESSPNGDE